MTPTPTSIRPRVFLAAMIASGAVGATAATGARNDSTPVGPLPAGPTTTTTTKPGLLVAVALPRARLTSGLVWRIARRYDSRIVRQISEADVRGTVVLVFKVVGRGETSLVFALTRGDASPKAVRAATHKIHSA
jgi:CO/xanthine dehydrogenase FAD-binding subunit